MSNGIQKKHQQISKVLSSLEALGSLFFCLINKAELRFLMFFIPNSTAKDCGQ